MKKWISCRFLALKWAAAVCAAGILTAAAPMAAAAEEYGPGVALEQKLEAERQAAQTGSGAAGQETVPAGEDQAGETDGGQQDSGDPVEVKAFYRAYFSGSGWSEEREDNYECAQAGTFMTGLEAGLRQQPAGMTGTLSYQVNVSGYGWQDWTENMGTAGMAESGTPLEAVRMELTGDLKDHYDVYYMAYQNGAWTEWAANGGTAGQEGAGLRMEGIRVAVVEKGEQPPAEPERVLTGTVDPARPMVALTFDDGPRAAVTNRILDSLQANGGRATFFMVGTNVNASNAAAIQRMAAMNCEVANHTNDHKYLSKIGADGIRAQVSLVNQKVQEICGVTPKLVRPPGGYYDQASLNVLASMGMPAVMWSIDTRDWQHRDPAKTISSVLDHVQDGDIVLMHDIYGTTADAAEVIIPELVKRGYQLVTVSELAAYRGGMAPGHAYSRFR